MLFLWGRIIQALKLMNTSCSTQMGATCNKLCLVPLSLSLSVVLQQKKTVRLVKVAPLKGRPCVCFIEKLGNL